MSSCLDKACPCVVRMHVLHAAQYDTGINDAFENSLVRAVLSVLFSHHLENDAEVIATEIQ